LEDALVHDDRYGLALSTSSAQAAAAYIDGVDRMLAAWPGAEDALDAAISADPDFALASIARARVHFVNAQVKPAQALAAQARELVARNGTERERSHVETLALAMEGKPAAALDHALAHLERWPRDAMIMVLPLGAFGLFAFSGMSDHDSARVELCERYAHHYGDDWFFLTYLGWSHTENGNVRHGRAITERAFALKNGNAHAVHALAHAMFEDGSGDDADRLIADWLPSYDRVGLMHGHIVWHQALVALEQGDAGRALDIYVARLQPHLTTAPPINSVTDSVSLLWRLTAYGHEVPKNLWTDAAGHAEQSFPKAGVPFADMHVALAAAATGNDDLLGRRVGELEQRLASGRLVTGPVLPVIYRALQAFGAGDYDGSASLLAPSAHEVVRIGGSHAQREIIEDTLILALMKSGRAKEAGAIIDERLHRRPSPRDAAWRSVL